MLEVNENGSGMKEEFDLIVPCSQWQWRNELVHEKARRVLEL